MSTVQSQKIKSQSKVNQKSIKSQSKVNQKSIKSQSKSPSKKIKRSKDQKSKVAPSKHCFGQLTLTVRCMKHPIHWKSVHYHNTSTTAAASRSGSPRDDLPSRVVVVVVVPRHGRRGGAISIHPSVRCVARALSFIHSLLHGPSRATTNAGPRHVVEGSFSNNDLSRASSLALLRRTEAVEAKRSIRMSQCMRWVHGSVSPSATVTPTGRRQGAEYGCGD